MQPPDRCGMTKGRRRRGTTSGQWRTIGTLLLPLLLLLQLHCPWPSPSVVSVSAHDVVPCGPTAPLPPVVRTLIMVLCDGPLGVLAANPNDPASGCAVDTTPRGVHVRNFLDGATCKPTTCKMQRRGQLTWFEGTHTHSPSDWLVAVAREEPEWDGDCN